MKKSKRTHNCLNIGILVLLTGFISCDASLFSKRKDPVVAEVGERRLFLSQLEGLVSEGTSKQDSVAIVEGFIQNWIRERLMVEEAAGHIAADINLDKLVDDYRSSLLVYHYENRLTATSLDTIVPEVEMREYYEKNKNNYILSHPLIRCLVAKCPSGVKGLSDVKSAMQKSDLTEALFLAQEKAVFHQLDTSHYMTMEDINALLPEGMLDETSLSAGRVVTSSSRGYEYIVRILSFHGAGSPPPFDYLTEKLKKTILSDRRIQLLKRHRQNLYQKALEDNRFKMYKIDVNG